MAWIYDTCEVLHPGSSNRPVVTGMPVEMGGSRECSGDTGSGCIFATLGFLAKALPPDRQEIAGAHLMIQGFGVLGASAAHGFCRESECIIDSSGSRATLR